MDKLSSGQVVREHIDEMLQLLRAPSPAARVAQRAEGGGVMEDYRDKIREEIEKLCDDLRREKYEAIEKLTRQQTFDILREMLESGDFVRYTNIHETAQSVAYIPFHRDLQNKQRIAELEAELEETRDCGEELASATMSMINTYNTSTYTHARNMVFKWRREQNKAKEVDNG